MKEVSWMGLFQKFIKFQQFWKIIGQVGPNCFSFFFVILTECLVGMSVLYEPYLVKRNFITILLTKDFFYCSINIIFTQGSIWGSASKYHSWCLTYCIIQSVCKLVLFMVSDGLYQLECLQASTIRGVWYIASIGVSAS